MRKVVAGNWKMHHGPREAREFFEAFDPPSGADARLVIFPPTISLPEAVRAVSGRSGVALGIQNIHAETAGAFTGETSAEMAVEAGAELALVGHSERRHLFGETVEQTRDKVEAAYRAGLEPVLCLGETLEERKAGRLADIVLGQLDTVMASPSVRATVRDGTPFLVAYEPVWAIGTGETATPQDATEAHGILRDRLRDHLGEDRAREIPILYGGSVKPENAADLLAAEDVDGVLVGGASLKSDSFARIAAAAG